MEVASFLADKAKSVSVVDIIKVPFELVLGAKIGTVLQKVLFIETNRVVFLGFLLNLMPANNNE